MNKRDKNKIIKKYQKRFKEYGKDIQALASGDKERQRIRFKVLSEVGDLNSSSVLDLGCGFGDFYQYLKDKGIKVDYTGYDIVPEFIEFAKERHPEAKFELRDIQEMPPNRKFDYIVSSQTFNNKLVSENNEDVVKSILSLCYKLCKVGVAIDMLTTHVDFNEDRLYYYNPEEIFKFCKTLTKRVTLRHDSPLFEFTIYLYKDFKGWRNS